MEELISVIVPVYKVEAYLDRCVASIVNQTYKNLEIILVDDGSPDNCPALCDAWAEKDSRVKVIHQENRGAGAARNRGLDAAGGSLIAFADSDDYLHPEMYAHLHSLMENGADIAECGHMDVTGDGAAFPTQPDRIREFSAPDAMREHIQDRLFRQLIWNKLFRREVIGDIRFPEGKRIDDEFFTYLVLGNAKKLVRSQRVCYAYRQQAGSVMHNLAPEKRLQAVDAKCRRHDYLAQKFPELVPDSLVDLWFTCLYQGQLALRSGGDCTEVLSGLKQALKQHPLVGIPQGLSLTHRVWLSLASISFTRTCALRNFLKVGL